MSRAAVEERRPHARTDRLEPADGREEPGHWEVLLRVGGRVDIKRSDDQGKRIL